MEDATTAAIDVAPTMTIAPAATITPITDDMAKAKAKVKELTATKREV
jgi:hypothetical protein